MDRRSARQLLEHLNRDAERIAAAFGLRYRAIEAERAHVKRRYGVCYSDGTIRIRLRHATSGRPLKYSSLISTLCHELAHLRHFHHGPSFRRYNARILAWARAHGIYRPGRRVVALEAPAQGARLGGPAVSPEKSPPEAPARRLQPGEGPHQLPLFGPAA